MSESIDDTMFHLNEALKNYDSYTVGIVNGKEAGLHVTADTNAISIEITSEGKGTLNFESSSVEDIYRVGLFMALWADSKRDGSYARTDSDNERSGGDTETEEEPHSPDVRSETD